MMAKNTDVKVVMKAINSSIEKSLKGKDLWKEVGQQAVSSIRATTVKGAGVSEKMAKAEKFEALATSTIKSRKTKKLSPLTRASTSNLRETGQMFDDLQEYPTEKNVAIKFKNKRSQEIANYHHEGSSIMPQRKFLELSKAQYELITRLIRQNIVKKIKRR
jgi:hypothetical protein